MRSDDGGGGARVGNGSALGCCGVRGCCWLLRELLLREEDSPEEVELALASCRSDGDDGCGGWGDEDAFGGGCEVPMISSSPSSKGALVAAAREGPFLNRSSRPGGEGK